MIDDAMILPITEAIRDTCLDLDVKVSAVGVMPDHVHVLAHIPPTHAIAPIVGRWKGASSFAANAKCPDALARLAWQRGYGVVSVSPSGFERVLEYVQNQRERHARREIYRMLERSDDQG